MTRFLVLLAVLSSSLPAQISIGGGATGVGATVYNITVQGNGSTDNTAAVNAALASCKDVLLDNGVIAGNVVPASGCHQTLYLTTALHLSAPLMLTTLSLVGLQGNAVGLYGQGVPITQTTTLPTCANSPVITATGSMGATSFTVSSNTPLAIGSWVGFSSISGGPYKIANITGTTISISPATLTAAVPGGTNVVCETPGGISINSSNVRIAGVNVNGVTTVVNGGDQPVAQVEIYNSSFYNGVGLVPFVVDGAFEIYVKESAFQSSGSHAVQITNENTTFVGQNITFDTCLFTVGNVYINSNNSTGLGNHVNLINEQYESLSTNMVDVDTTSGQMSSLLLERITSSDSGSTGYMVNRIAGTNSIINVTIQDATGRGNLTLSNVTLTSLTGATLSLPL